MINADDLKLEILSEPNTSLKDLLAYVNIKKELFNKDEKHELFIRIK